MLSDLLQAPEFTLFSDSNHILYYGQGPFTESATPPKNGSAFYLNDYKLTDAKPWKIPTKIIEIPQSSDHFTPKGYLKPNPKPLDPTAFAHIFQRIMQAIQDGRIRKSVPSVTEHFLRSENTLTPEALMERLILPREHQYAFAYKSGDSGFAGFTPEYLFTKEKNILKTMALAGTAPCDEENLFLLDEKEIQEHEFVVGTLLSQLSLCGKIDKSTRQIARLKHLIHFLTHIEVKLDRDIQLNSLIKALHPTPALGPLPRTDETLALHYEWRNELETPAYFGAPFGFLHKGKFQCVIMIRGVHWDNEQFSLPVGCGVISESRLTHEWNELKLKRTAVLKNLELSLR